MKIPVEVESILETLKQNGYEAYAVGGCVRDTLLGRTPEDWDITTSAMPKQVKALFRRTVDTGIQHGTVTVLIGKNGYEVTTYRIDGEYEDCRHPKEVLFTSDLLEDLRRRDFTINAMAYSHETGIVDAFGGKSDLEHKIIRCVGAPMERFGEDALRILRAIRFSAQLGFTIESETLRAISAIAPNIARVSRERIQTELTKLLLSDHPKQIRMVYETGISPFISPAFAALDWKQTDIPAELPVVKYVRWAAFLRLTSSEKAVEILKELKMDNDTLRKVKTLTAWSGRSISGDGADVRRAMSQMDGEVWDALLELNRYPQEIRAWTCRIRENGDCLDLKHLAVTGQDLIAAGIAPGKRLGEILEQLLEQVLENPERNTREILLNEAKKFTKTP